MISLFALKNEVRTFNDEPNKKKVVEIPKVKNNVFLNNEFFAIPLLVILSRLLFDSILKYTGKIGNIHGDKKEINPSKKTILKFKFSIKISLNSPNFVLLSCNCHRMMATHFLPNIFDMDSTGQSVLYHTLL